ncbi:MAG: hypothetical protein FJ299_04040 [Planctomycetes bacterium]|nr:hypothetical protein [Planctomycetota bacterium]
MANTTAEAARNGVELRQCPTRIDRAPVRIAQSIQISLCQDRQRGMYHKCFSCEHANGRAAEASVAVPERIKSRA